MSAAPARLLPRHASPAVHRFGTPAEAPATARAPLPAVAPGQSLVAVRAAGTTPTANEPIDREAIMTATFSLNFAALSIGCADPAALADVARLDGPESDSKSPGPPMLNPGSGHGSPIRAFHSRCMAARPSRVVPEVMPAENVIPGQLASGPVLITANSPIWARRSTKSGAEVHAPPVPPSLSFTYVLR